MVSAGSVKMNIVNDILVNTLFPDTDFIQTLAMNNVVPKYVENQEKGNPSVCKNCAEAPFKDLHIYGRSEQMTTTGAQLLDTSKLQERNCTMKIEEQGRKITITGRGAFSGARIATADIGMFSDAIGKQIFISGKATVLSGNAIVAVALSYVLDGVVSYIAIGGSGFATKIIPDGATLETLQINVNHSNEALDEDTTVVFEDLIVGIGSAALPFEPYTGGKPSPSPDYPQEIQSAGDDGNLNVMVSGKNLWQGGDFEVLVGHSPTGFAFAPQDLADKVKALPNDTYSLSYKPIGSGNAGTNIGKVSLIQEDGSQIDLGETITLTDEVRNKIVKIGIYGYLDQTNKITKLQIERSHEPTDYEPYRIPQIFTISTNLPGIPVDSDGNYTDPQGQQWICDEVDLGRGVYVQRVDKGAFDATKALTEQSVILATPIETPLTAAEIADYKSFRTYRGTTIVEAEDKAGIFVKYNMPMPKLSKNGALRRWFKRHPII